MSRANSWRSAGEREERAFLGDSRGKAIPLNGDREQSAVAATGADAGDPSAGDRPVRARAVLVLAATAVLVLLADLGTKHLALLALQGSEPVRLLDGAVYLTLVRNSGAAFGLGAEHTWIFPVIALAVVAWIGWMATRLRSVPWALSLGLVLGGALGNLTDRIFRAPGTFVGHVIDMVSLFDPYGQVWPVFNLADSALVGGVILAVLLELTGRQRDGTRHPARAGEDGDVGERDRT